MNEVDVVFRFCKPKQDGGYSNGLVTFNACVNCPDAIFGEKDALGVYEIKCCHDKNHIFYVRNKKCGKKS